MFLLHQRTRKALCRFGFVLFCVLPTCAIALWAAERNSEAHRALCEAHLSRELRARAAIDDVVHLQPGAMRYTGLLVADPQTKRPIVGAPVLEARLSDHRVTVFTSQLKVHSQQLAVLSQMLHDRLRAGVDAQERLVRLSAGEVTIDSADGDWNLVDAGLRLEPTASGRGGRLTFRTPAMEKEAPPVAVTLVRSHDATTAFELDTQGTSLPLALVFAASGNDAPLAGGSFSGFVQMQSAADGWQGVARGTISGMDLDREFGSRFAHRLTGMAEVQIRHASFCAGRLEEAEGRFVASKGAIAGSLISAMERSLRLRRATQSADQDAMIPYDWLAFDFLIDQRGVQIKGCAPDAGPGTVLCRQGAALLIEPVGPSGPAVQLVRTLLPDTNAMVPATREALALLRVLPIPSSPVSQ